MKKNVVNYISITAIIVLFSSSIYFKFYNESYITVSVYLYLSIYESHPWGQIKNVNFITNNYKKIDSDNITLIFKYPDKIKDVKYILKIELILNEKNSTREYEIKNKLIYNGIYEGEIFHTFKHKGSAKLKITITAFENSTKKNFDKNIYNIEIVK